MTIVSHVLVTTAGVQLLNLHGSEMVFAYIFGYFLPDADHVVKLPLYFKKHNFKIAHIFKKPFPHEKHYNWRTSLQEPIALLWIVPLSIFLNSPVPIIFFGSHVILDYLMSYKKAPFYPFSNFETRGLFMHIPDRTKELVVIFISLCSILLLM